MAVLAVAWEAGTALWQWSAWLTLWASVAAVLRAVVVIGAEGAIATDRTRILAVPRRYATKAARATTEWSSKVHVAKAVDEIVLATLGEA